MLKKIKESFLILGFLMIMATNFACVNNNKKPADSLLTKEMSDPNYDPQSKLIFKEKYENTIPGYIPVQEKFEGGHPKLLNYIFIKTLNAKIMERPATNVPVVRKCEYYERLELLGVVEQKGGTKWYKVKDLKGKIGYVYAPMAEKRVFQFQKTLEHIEKVENFVREARENGETLAVVNSYSPNPNNVDFKRSKDKYGVSLDQNISATYKGEAIYIPDRSIVKIIYKEGNKSKVKALSIPEPYLDSNSSNFVADPKLNNSPINKAIAIDIKNQNMIIYEKIDGKWTIISYVYSKTGIESQLGFETPRGYFMAAVSKFEMLYNGEIGNKEGYAKYATRFSGGGYLHGTPLNYEEEINKEYFVSLKEWTLGTVSGTRKCIRTNEDHASFVFRWILNNKLNNSQNEQVIKDNVLFVIF